ncbi:MAG TPA: ATP-binding protein [Candidatus Saccharimonadales bacterium]|jgi:PAS domain S-box-containing protein
MTDWYRKLSVVSAFSSAVVVSLWLLSTFVVHEAALRPLLASTPAIIMIAIALVISVVLLLMQRQPSWLVASLVVLLGAGMLLASASTGTISSPYMALWVVVGVGTAVAGIISWTLLLLAATVYVGYMYAYQPLSGLEWIVLMVLLYAPLVAAATSWRLRARDHRKTNQAVTQLTRELSQESTKSDIIVNAIADGVILVDQTGIIKLINPAAEQIVGWGREDALNLDYRSVLKIVDNKDQLLEGDADPVQHCLKSGTSVITDKHGLRTVSGKQLLASIMVSPLGSTGEGAIIVFRDITMQRAEEREQVEFISTASHEMRTPVAAIEGYLGLALNPATASVDEKARAYITKAHESATHLGRLFQDLLDISRLEDGRMASHPATIDLTAYAMRLIEEFQPQAAAKGLTLTYGPSAAAATTGSISPIYYANVDPDHLHEIMANLLTNAIKYTKAGAVRLDLTGDEDHVFLSVTDSGIGISAEDLPHLFQKFYRVDNSDTREVGGTGLGLYLARRLVEAMGGRLSVQSTYGAGSTFSVDLPRASEPAAAQAAQVAAAAGTPLA